MNGVPYPYQNVINPWQRPREIKLAIKFINQMLKHWPEPDALKLLRADEPAREWG